MADLQSVHGFRCYDNLQMHVAPNAKCQRVLVLALWLVDNGGDGGEIIEIVVAA